MFAPFASQNATLLERGGVYIVRLTECHRSGGRVCLLLLPCRMSPSLWEGRRLTDGEGLLLPLAQRFHVIHSRTCSLSLAKLIFQTNMLRDTARYGFYILDDILV